MNNEQKTARRNRYIEMYGGVCVRCGSTERLEFDHIDPRTKTVRYLWSLGTARLEADLKNCQLLCAPCHHKKTKDEYDEFHRSRVCKGRHAGCFPKLQVIHGTHTGRYHYGCQCEPCRIAYNDFEKARYNKDTEYMQAEKDRLKSLRAAQSLLPSLP